MRVALLAGWLTVAGAGCAVRAPATLDVGALIATHGAADARFTLTQRVLADPHDLQARLALAELDDSAGLPGAAIVQLEAVVAVGGPAGTRWHAADRARLGRLLLARARVRLERNAASAQDDLVRARELGAPVTPAELARARAAIAIGQLRDVQPTMRRRGRLAIEALADDPTADASWRGAKRDATAADVGAFGVWLWRAGARRAAVEELEAWHAMVKAPRDATLQTAYLDALAWWLPFALGEVAPPPASELVGDARCQFPGAPACSAREVVASDGDDGRALVSSPIATRTRDPDEAAAWAILIVNAWLRGETPLRAGLAARVDLAALRGEPVRPFATVPAFARPLFAQLAGDTRAVPPIVVPTADTPIAQRTVIAIELALAGHAERDVTAALVPPVSGSRHAFVVRAEAPPPISDDPRADAAARSAVARLAAFASPAAGTPTLAQLRAIAAAFRRDPGIADRLARALVDASVDDAIAHASVGALFDALADPARARRAWQAAADGSREPAMLRGLAEAEARAGDADAALINGAVAAAASGDPAVVWIAIARALAGAGKAQHAIDAAHRGIELASAAQLPAALDVAIAASRTMGRDEQAAELAARRAKLAPAVSATDDAGASATDGANDPTDVPAAIAAYHARGDASAIARLWVASRWSGRDVGVRVVLRAALAVGDARRAVVEAELVEIAGEAGDPTDGIAAAQALR